eukprot:1411579-Pyramimonas_sp.AAC.1
MRAQARRNLQKIVPLVPLGSDSLFFLGLPSLDLGPDPMQTSRALGRACPPTGEFWTNHEKQSQHTP